jgi:hypothetical protein
VRWPPRRPGSPRARRPADLAGDQAWQPSLTAGRPARRLRVRAAHPPALPRLCVRRRRPGLVARLRHLDPRQRHRAHHRQRPKSSAQLDVWREPDFVAKSGNPWLLWPGTSRCNVQQLLSNPGRYQPTPQIRLPAGQRRDTASLICARTGRPRQRGVAGRDASGTFLPDGRLSQLGRLGAGYRRGMPIVT